MASEVKNDTQEGKVDDAGAALQQVHEEVGRLFQLDSAAFYAAIDEISQEVSSAKEAGKQKAEATFIDRKRQWIKKLQDFAVAALIEESKEARAELKLKLADDDQELGSVVQQALGGRAWQDGNKPKLLKRKLAEIEQLRQDSKVQGREIRKGDGDNKLALEIHKRQLELYKRHENEIKEQFAEHAAEKALHIKEDQRIRDETQSPFGKFPLLDHGRYLVLSLLDKGGFSEVWRACDLETCTMVAMKVHQSSVSWPAERKAQYFKHARREFEIQQQSRHPRVVSLLDCFELNQSSFCTILEFSPYGNLDSYLKKHRELAESTARPIMAQVLSGLAYLHSRRIIHYDLKPANILFFSHSEIKLTDFGLSKSMSAAAKSQVGDDTCIELTSQGTGTYWYLPPECFETRFVPKVTAKVDIWAAGVVFYQMLFGKRPFGDDVSQKQIFTQGIIANAKSVTFPAKKKVSDASKAIIQTCLKYDAADRPSAADLLKDPYFFQASVGPGARKMQKRAAAAVRSERAAET